MLGSPKVALKLDKKAGLSSEKGAGVPDPQAKSIFTGLLAPRVLSDSEYEIDVFTAASLNFDGFAVRYLLQDRIL